MRDVDQNSVTRLLHNAKTGCESSRSKLINQLQSYMHLMAEVHADSSTHQKLGPSDIVQQSVIKVLKGFDGFRGSSEGELKSWMKQILMNEIKLARRALHREKRDVTRERSIHNSKHGLRNALHDDSPTPRSNAIKHEQLAILRKAIENLPKDYAVVIKLRSLERLSFKQVARQMDRTPDAVTKLWYRAILKLQQTMNQDIEASG